MEARVATEREGSNEDICAVLATLVSPDTASFDVEALAAFRLDHAHHPERLPQLLRELEAITAGRRATTRSARAA